MVSLYRDPKGEKLFARTVSTWIHNTINLAWSEKFVTMDQDSALGGKGTEYQARLPKVRINSIMTIEFLEFYLKHHNSCSFS